MPITVDFSHCDRVVADLSPIIAGARDPLFVSRCAGFVTVAAVCVYEMAVKEIFIEFAAKKHPILGTMTRETFERINGQIAYDVLRNKYLPLFGDKYKRNFLNRVATEKAAHLRATGRDTVSAYNNLIVWRNEFVHAGRAPATATYSEVVQAYEDGKQIISLLNSTMYR